MFISKLEKSMITNIIDERVKSLQHDIMIIETNYFDGYVLFKNSEYKNEHVHTLVETGIAESTLSILHTINIEKEIYETFSDDDFIEELTYILNVNVASYAKETTELILNAKYELALFSLSGIGKEYTNKVKAIKNAADKAARYSEVTGSLSIPKNRTTIIKSLSTKLDQLHSHLSQEEAREIIDTILTVLFDYERIPSYKIATRNKKKKRNNRQYTPVVVETIDAPSSKKNS